MSLHPFCGVTIKKPSHLLSTRHFVLALNTLRLTFTSFARRFNLKFMIFNTFRVRISPRIFSPSPSPPLVFVLFDFSLVFSTPGIHFLRKHVRDVTCLYTNVLHVLVSSLACYCTHAWVLSTLHDSKDCTAHG